MDAARTAETTEQARCHHCGALTAGGRFLPGHDAKHVANLVSDVMYGGLTYEAALGDCPTIALQNKVTQILRRRGYFAATEDVIEAFRAAEERWGGSLLHYAYTRFTDEGRAGGPIPREFVQAHAVALHFIDKTGREIVRITNDARS
jgi:hypothetical protein